MLSVAWVSMTSVFSASKQVQTPELFGLRTKILYTNHSLILIAGLAAFVPITECRQDVRIYYRTSDIGVTGSS